MKRKKAVFIGKICYETYNISKANYIIFSSFKRKKVTYSLGLK